MIRFVQSMPRRRLGLLLTSRIAVPRSACGFAVAQVAKSVGLEIDGKGSAAKASGGKRSVDPTTAVRTAVGKVIVGKRGDGKVIAVSAIGATATAAEASGVHLRLGAN